ncbi:hypothetical protein Tco_1555522 [Tanacetum coccineum]
MAILLNANLRCVTVDLVSNDGWKWHQAWLNKAPDLNIVPAPNLSVNCRDTMYWRASNVWLNVRQLAEMEAIPPLLSDIIAQLQPMAKKKSTTIIIDRLLLAATSYFLGIERNNRLFKNSRRSSEELRDIIMVTVRLKLLSFRFKNRDNVTRRRRMDDFLYENCML